MPDIQVIWIQPVRVDPHRFSLGEHVAHVSDEVLESLLKRAKVFLRNHTVMLLKLDVAIVHP